MNKVVNIYPKSPILTVNPPIRSFVRKVTKPVAEIRECIIARAIVEEILADGSTVRLNLNNYDKDNNIDVFNKVIARAEAQTSKVNNSGESNNETTTSVVESNNEDKSSYNNENRYGKYNKHKNRRNNYQNNKFNTKDSVNNNESNKEEAVIEAEAIVFAEDTTTEPIETKDIESLM